MNTIPQSSAVQLRMNYPTEWDASGITGIDIEIVSTDATELLAATAATIYTATTLGAAATSGLRTITIDSGSDDLVSGDLIQLTEPREDVVVYSYDTTTKIATLTTSLVHDHADDTDVFGRFATYELDASDTSVWITGLVCGIYWESDLGLRAPELAVVGPGGYSIRSFADRFRTLYPNEFRLIEQRADQWIAEIKTMFGLRMSSMGVNIDAINDTKTLDSIMMQYARMMAATTGGDSWNYERRIAREEYLDSETRFLKSPIWQDENHDQIEGPNEAGSAEQPQVLSRWF